MARLVRSRPERLAGYRRVLEARALDVTEQRLRSLAQDEIRPVRLWTARSSRCPGDALVVLAHDEDGFVRWNALLNVGMPEAGLQYLAELEAYECRNVPNPWFIVRAIVLAHPNVSTQLADQLRELGAIADPGMLS